MKCSGIKLLSLLVITFLAGSFGVILASEDMVTKDTILLAEGQNYIAMPLLPDEPYTASQFIKDIELIDDWEVLRFFKVPVIKKHRKDRDLYFKKYPKEDVTCAMVPGKAYRIDLAYHGLRPKTGPLMTEVYVEGKILDAPVPLKLKKGWNAISVAFPRYYSLSQLSDELLTQGIKATRVSFWSTKNKSWEQYDLPYSESPQSGYIKDYETIEKSLIIFGRSRPIRPDEGFLLYCKKKGIFTPGGVEAPPLSERVNYTGWIEVADSKPKKKAPYSFLLHVNEGSNESSIFLKGVNEEIEGQLSEVAGSGERYFVEGVMTPIKYRNSIIGVLLVDEVELCVRHTGRVKKIGRNLEERPPFYYVLSCSEDTFIPLLAGEYGIGPQIAEAFKEGGIYAVEGVMATLDYVVGTSNTVEVLRVKNVILIEERPPTEGIAAYNTTSTPALVGVFSLVTWADKETDEILVSSFYDTKGMTVLNPRQGKSFTYRTTGIWDTTSNSTGELIPGTMKIVFDPRDPASGDRPHYAWRDNKTGLIYLCTDNSGINIIDTKKTEDLTDDEVVEVYSNNTQPALLRWDPDYGFNDDLGNIYLGHYHVDGFVIIHADRTATAYKDTGVYDVSLDKTGTLIRETPRLGSYHGYDGDATPFFKDVDDNLYVGTTCGFTVYYYNHYNAYYDKTLTYRVDGLYDTTSDSRGVLINPEIKIAGNSVRHAWQDDDGNIYLSCCPSYNPDTQSFNYDEGGFSIIRPNGEVENFTPTTTPAVPRWVLHSWKDEEGALYLSTSYDWKYPYEPEGGIVILYPDGSKRVLNKDSYPSIGKDSVWGTWWGAFSSWMDSEGRLWVNAADEIIAIPPEMVEK